MSSSIGGYPLGKSLVIYDDFGPKTRGERLGCALITRDYGRKAIAHDWYSNGAKLSFNGKIEILQQSEYDLSNVVIELNGLIESSSYHIHMAPIEANLAFPCEKFSLYEIWNPRNLDSKYPISATEGSSDQYKIGDLSGKFGTLEGYTKYKTWYNDTNLPLFGYESVLGRSVVIHKKANNQRWVCSTIEAGYSPHEARQVSAIASFHNPTGYAFGYIRLKQIIYRDGSGSETTIEVNLRHPGKNDRNIIKEHQWQVHVNPVGVDSSLKEIATRCVAGGYIWNPYYTQLADPLNVELYSHECGPDNPLRCHVGDVSTRDGKIDIGYRHLVFTDSNPTLDGPVSAIGRSIVIFGANSSQERFACANIEYDDHIVKHINLQKPPRFLIAKFLEDVRHVTEAPEWMLNVDARTINTLHGGACIQMIMHFQGPFAHQLEVDLSGLLARGILNRPSVNIPGYSNPKRKKTLAYRTCEVLDPTEENHLTTPLPQPARQGILAQMVLVMLHHLLMQLHTYVQFMPNDHGECDELSTEYDLGPPVYEMRSELSIDNDEDLNASSLLSMSSQPLPVPNTSRRSNTEDRYSAADSTCSDNIVAQPSSSHKSNYSITQSASLSSDNCGTRSISSSTHSSRIRSSFI